MRMTEPTVTFTITIEADASNLEDVLARLATALGADRPACSCLIGAAPTSPLDRRSIPDDAIAAPRPEERLPRKSPDMGGPAPCTVPGCGFVERTAGGLGPHRKAKHPELVGLAADLNAWPEPTAARITEPTPTPPVATTSLDHDGHTIDVGPVTVGEPASTPEADPTPRPAPRPPAQYRPDEHRCGCGATFPFRADLARHRLAEDHHADDEVDA